MALSSTQITRLAVGGSGRRYAGFTAKGSEATFPRGTVGPFTRIAVGGPGLRYPGFVAKGAVSVPPEPASTVTEGAGSGRPWSQRALNILLPHRMRIDDEDVLFIIDD